MNINKTAVLYEAAVFSVSKYRILFFCIKQHLYFGAKQRNNKYNATLETYAYYVYNESTKR